MSSTSATTATADPSSTLQFRRVRASRPESCGTQPENPAGDEPVTLGGAHETCYDLDPAVLTIRPAEAYTETSPGGETVFLELSPADTPAVRQVLSETLHQQLATVMLGRVLSAPTIQSAEIDGPIVIAGLDPETAQDVVEAVSG